MLGGSRTGLEERPTHAGRDRAQARGLRRGSSPAVDRCDQDVGGSALAQAAARPCTSPAWSGIPRPRGRPVPARRGRHRATPPRRPVAARARRPRGAAGGSCGSCPRSSPGNRSGRAIGLGPLVAGRMIGRMFLTPWLLAVTLALVAVAAIPTPTTLPGGGSGAGCSRCISSQLVRALLAASGRGPDRLLVPCFVAAFAAPLVASPALVRRVLRRGGRAAKMGRRGTPGRPPASGRPARSGCAPLRR